MKSVKNLLIVVALLTGEASGGTVDNCWEDRFEDTRGAVARMMPWAPGGTDPEMCVIDFDGGTSGSGVLGIVDSRSDAGAQWQSPSIPLPERDSLDPDQKELPLSLRLSLRHRIWNGSMRIIIRGYTESMALVSDETFSLTGESRGFPEDQWELIEKTFAVPRDAVQLRVWLNSGAAATEGELYVDFIQVCPLWETQGYLPVSAPAQTHGIVHPLKFDLRYNAQRVPRAKTLLYESDFESAFGTIPNGWHDLTFEPPSRNWMVDADGRLRVVLKRHEGLAVYSGLLTTGAESKLPDNYVIRSDYTVTVDDDVYFGLAGRVVDSKNFYVVRAYGGDRVKIVKRIDGHEQVLSDLVFLERQTDGEVWTLEASFYDDLITGIVRNSEGRVMARIDARDGEFADGQFGINATDFAAALNIACFSQERMDTSLALADVRRKNPPPRGSVYTGYTLVKPLFDHHPLQSSFDALDDRYDVVVAGAGTGGWAVAIQAAQQGHRVLMLEETDWLGGQMGAAAVTSMDEAGSQVRERGIYRLFHESVVAYYYGLNKSPFMAYYYQDSAQNQMDGGYEPAATQAVLYAMIQRVRDAGGILDLSLRSTVQEVGLEGGAVNGVTVRKWNEGGEKFRTFTTRLLVDATEYGDVIPLTGSPYRVGNTTSWDLDLNAPLQSHSFNLVFREYSDGIPDHLRMTVPPPTYEVERRRFHRGRIHGDWDFHRRDRNVRILMAWRGAADAHSPLTGRRSEVRHTAASTNWANNYRVNAAVIEDPDVRKQTELLGVYRMLSALYYAQNELGMNWSIAEEQGYNTEYNRLMMEARGVDPAVMPFAVMMCQIPYVRESRRIVGVETLVANDLSRWEDAKHMPTSVAMGDYFIDLHGTYESIERDLDTLEHPRGTGPFQVPFEVFIPAELDGFLPAEKNFSQSRLVSGATRLQPITMLTGQAVGAIVSQALDRGLQPRQLNPMVVQIALLDEGSTLVPRWYKDVEWNTELWRAIQFLSLYGILDRTGRIHDIHEMSFVTPDSWGVGETIDSEKRTQEVMRLAALLEKPAPASLLDGASITRDELALRTYRWVRSVIFDRQEQN